MNESTRRILYWFLLRFSRRACRGVVLVDDSCMTDVEVKQCMRKIKREIDAENMKKCVCFWNPKMSWW